MEQLTTLRIQLVARKKIVRMPTWCFFLDPICVPWLWDTSYLTRPQTSTSLKLESTLNHRDRLHT